MDKEDKRLKVKQLLDNCGLTQAELASRIPGLKQHHISEYVSGVRNITDAFILKLSTALNTNLGYLLDKPISVAGKTSQESQPYYDSDFLLGFTEVLESSAITPEKYLKTTVGDKDCFWCSASGHSMEPEIWGGDKICMKKIVLEPNCFEFGKIYGIVTKNGIRTIKYVRRANDDEHIRLVPRNHDSVYGDYQDIHLSDVLQVFKVIATMRALY